MKRIIPIALGAVALVGCSPDVEGTANLDRPVAPATFAPDKAPAICLKALDNADALIAIVVEAMGYMKDAFYAASELDADGIEAANEQVEAITPRAGEARLAYDEAAEACRSL